MAAVTITAADVRIVELVQSYTAPAAAAITAGQYMRLNTTTGKFELGNASSAPNLGNIGFLCTRSVDAGFPVVGVKKGILNLGESLASLNFGSQVFVNDTAGSLGDAAGTSSKVVGVVFPGWATSAANADKLLYVDM
jgi:hypothetical protein